MTLTRFEFTDRARPVMEVGLGSTVTDDSVAVWDVSLWDAPGSTWNGNEPLWRDVSCDVVDAHIELGRGRVTDSFPVGIADITVDNVSGWADPSIDVEDSTAGYLSFGAGSYMSVADYSALSITGDISIMIRFRTDSWPPTGTEGIVGTLLEKVIRLNVAGQLEFVTVNGFTDTTVTSSVITPSSDWRWYYVALDVDNGAGGHSWKWWYGGAGDDPQAWSLYNSGSAAGVLSINDTSNPLIIGYADVDGVVADIGHVSIRSGFGPSLTVGGSTVFEFNGWDLDGTTIIRHFGEVDLPGTNGNYLSTPHTAALGITGSITVVAHIAADVWATGALQTIVGKLHTSGGQRSWSLRMGTTGLIRWVWSADGATTTTVDSSAPGFVNGGYEWIAVTFVTNDGAGNKQTRFWGSDDGATWTLISTPGPSAGTTSLFNATSAVLEISGNDAGTAFPFGGLVDYVSVRSGTGASGAVGGTEVFRFDADVDLNGVNPAATSFTSTLGHVMTVNRSGSPSTTLISQTVPTITPRVGLNPMVVNGDVSVVAAVQPDATHLRLRPGRPIRVGVVHQTFGTKWLYSGFIDLIEPVDDPEDWSTVKLSCIDALGEAGRAKMATRVESGANEQANTRFARILDEIKWPSTKRSISESAVRHLLAAELSGQVVDLLRQTADSEGGWAFGDTNGNVVLQHRDWLYRVTGSAVDATIGNLGGTDLVLLLEDDTSLLLESGEEILLDGSGSDVCPGRWTRAFDRRDITTRVILDRDLPSTWVGDPPDPVIAEDAQGKLLYGIEPFERLDLWTSNTGDLQQQAGRVLATRAANVSMPRIRSVALDAATGDAVIDVLSTLSIFTPSRYRCRLSTDRGLVFDSHFFAVGVTHDLSADAWTAEVSLDRSYPFEVLDAVDYVWDTGRWDRSLWN